jgi:hypothetical protein
VNAVPAHARQLEIGEMPIWKKSVNVNANIFGSGGNLIQKDFFSTIANGNLRIVKKLGKSQKDITRKILTNAGKEIVHIGRLILKKYRKERANGTRKIQKGARFTIIIERQELKRMVVFFQAT